MTQIHIPRADPEITVDFVKEFFREFAPVESVDKSDNGRPFECQFHIKVKDWTSILDTLFQHGNARICYDDTGYRPSYFICHTL